MHLFLLLLFKQHKTDIWRAVGSRHLAGKTTREYKDTVRKAVMLMPRARYICLAKLEHCQLKTLAAF